MRKLFALLLCAMMLIGALVGCAENTAGIETTVPDYTGTFRAGYGRVDITPDPGISLAGFGDDGKRRSDYVRDHLYMTCVALTDENENTILLITYDNIRTEPGVYSAVRSKIVKTLGIPAQNILYSATHSHHTPDSAGGSYSTLIKEAALEAATAAMEDRKPAQMYTGNSYSQGLNFVRHYIMDDGSIVGDNYGDPTGKTYVKHETEVDNEIQLIKFAREGGKDIVMMNWRAHILGPNYRDISSGFVSSCRKRMEQELDCHFAYYQGCSGNVDDYSRIDGEENFKNLEEQGFKLAGYALEVMDKLEKVQTGTIEVKTTTYQGNMRRDSAEFAMACATFTTIMQNGGTLAEAIAATGGLVQNQYAVDGAQWRQNRYRANGGKFDLELYAISVGDIAFLGSPNELFDNTGMQIKEASPYEQTFILCYCNGRGGYVPSEPAFTNGCYERDTGWFVKGTAEELVTVYTSMLEELHAETPVEKPQDVFDSQLPDVR